MSATWDPNQYLKFTDHRLRPAVDLLARVPLPDAGIVYDLGCGPGNVTKLIAERWPDAKLTGVDSSPDMLDKARPIKGIAWQLADLATWRAETPADVVYSNAAFQWLDHHATLFPHLFAQVKPGGFLAVQMPRSHLNQSHQILYALAREPEWAPTLASLIRDNWVLEPQVYYDWLAPNATALDVWEAIFLHVLEGEDAVLNWVKGSVLRPFLDRLDNADRQKAFLRAYGERLAAAYPRRADGKTLYPFRRLFIVAQRA